MESCPQEFMQTTAEVASASWQHTITVLRKATLEYMATDDPRREALETVAEGKFWHMHVQLLEQLEMEEPGITEKIMTRAEIVSDELRHQEMVEFETVTLPQAERRAFLRGFMSPFK